jgi:hypothetical protein
VSGAARPDPWPAALRYWEPRRIVYNAVLTAIVIYNFARVWPRSRVVLAPKPFGMLLVLALIANLAYSAAYLFELALDPPSPGSRRATFIAGMLFAAALTWYWLVDEIIPSLGQF